MKKKLLFGFMAVVLVAGTILAGCAAPAPEAVAPAPAVPGVPAAPTWTEPYKVGFCASTSGGGAVAMVSELYGAEIAIDEINAAGGILGRPVEFISRDDRLDPDEAARIAKELIIKEKIDAFILSPVNSVQTPQLQLCKEYGIWSIGESGQDIEMMNDYMNPYGFSAGPIAPEQGKAFAVYMNLQPGVETYMTLAMDYTWGYSIVENIHKYVESDLKLLREFWVPMDETEFGSYVGAVEATKPDALIIVLFGAQFRGVTKQLAARGLVEQMQIIAFSMTEEVIDAGKDFPEGVVMMGNAEYWCANMTNPYFKAFREEYMKRRGRIPSFAAVFGYDRVMTLMQGITRANSFDPRAITIALEDATLMSLCGPIYLRGLTHSFVRDAFFGTTKWDESLGFCDVVNVLQISGWKTGLTDEEVLQYRKEHNVEFEPLSTGNWWEEVPLVK